MAFDYSLDFKRIDFRQQPELYRVGRGEQGVLMVEPYKSELLPHWRFKTPDIARQSAETLYQCYLDYQDSGDFVGMDMARKFIQMGYTRARRYTNYRGGRKYAEDGSVNERQIDPIKAESARIFYDVWMKIRQDQHYLALKRRHRQQYET